MHVGAGQPVGRHRGATGVVTVSRPRGHGLGDEQPRLDAAELLGQLREVQVLRHHAVLQGQDGLHHADRAGGGLTVPEVGLHRTEHARSGGAVHLREAVELDRVADRGAGAVCLDVADRAAVHLGGGQRGPVDGDLGLLRGRRDVDGVTVLVRGGAPHDGQDPVAVALGVGQTLQQEHHRGLARDEAVGFDVEGVAVTGRREHALGRAGGHLARLQHDRDATGEGEVALTVVDAAAAHVDRREARGARRVDGVGRPVRAKRVGDAPGGEAVVVSGEAVRPLDRVGIGGHQLVVAVSHADEHPGE